jgi:hypothetical protein
MEEKLEKYWNVEGTGSRWRGMLRDSRDCWVLAGGKNIFGKFLRA